MSSGILLGCYSFSCGWLVRTSLLVKLLGSVIQKYHTIFFRVNSLKPLLRIIIYTLCKLFWLFCQSK